MIQVKKSGEHSISYDVLQRTKNELCHKISSASNDVRYLHSELESRFDRIDAKFAGVDARFNIVDSEFEKLEANLEGIRADLSRVLAIIENLESKNKS